jgi:hypothetical protein
VQLHINGQSEQVLFTGTWLFSTIDGLYIRPETSLADFFSWQHSEQHDYLLQLAGDEEQLSQKHQNIVPEDFTANRHSLFDWRFLFTLSF